MGLVTPTPGNYEIVQYIPRNMHLVCALLCFVVIRYDSVLTISFRVTLLPLGKSYRGPNITELTWKYIALINNELDCSTNKSNKSY